MPNIKRIVLPGEPHHITHRGNYRQTIFHLDADRRLYLDLLTDATRHFGVSIQAYCLMSVSLPCDVGAGSHASWTVPLKPRNTPSAGPLQP